MPTSRVVLSPSPSSRGGGGGGPHRHALVKIATGMSGCEQNACVVPSSARVIASDSHARAEAAEADVDDVRSAGKRARSASAASAAAPPPTPSRGELDMTRRERVGEL